MVSYWHRFFFFFFFLSRLWRLCVGKQILIEFCVLVLKIIDAPLVCAFSEWIWVFRNWRIWGNNCIQQQSILNHHIAKKTVNKCEFPSYLTCSFLLPKPNGMYYIKGDFLCFFPSHPLWCIIYLGSQTSS